MDTYPETIGHLAFLTNVPVVSCAMEEEEEGEEGEEEEEEGVEEEVEEEEEEV